MCFTKNDAMAEELYWIAFNTIADILSKATTECISSSLRYIVLYYIYL